MQKTNVNSDLLPGMFNAVSSHYQFFKYNACKIFSQIYHKLIIMKFKISIFNNFKHGLKCTYMLQSSCT
jgi:hypothetical protein